MKDKRKLNLDKLKDRESSIISYKEALKDVEPIRWSKSVLLGKKKIIVKQ